MHCALCTDCIVCNLFLIQPTLNITLLSVGIVMFLSCSCHCSFSASTSDPTLCILHRPVCILACVQSWLPLHSPDMVTMSESLCPPHSSLSLMSCSTIQSFCTACWRTADCSEAGWHTNTLCGRIIFRHVSNSTPSLNMWAKIFDTDMK